MKEVKLKGVNFRGAIGAVERLAGKETADRAIAITKGAAGDALRNGEILAGGWYPAGWYAALLEAIEIAGARGPEFIPEVSREAIRGDFATLFKVISLFVSPARALDNATRVMARYYDGGKISVLEARDGRIRFQLDEYHGLDRRMWHDIIGGMEGVLLSMRVKSPRAQIVAGGNDGDASMTVELIWTP